MYLQYIVVVAWNAILSLLAQAIDVPSIRLLNAEVPSAKATNWELLHINDISYY